MTSSSLIALGMSLLCTLALPLFLLITKRLNLRSDAVLLTVYIQVVIYMCVMPLVSLADGDVPVMYDDYYTLVSVATLVLFTVPLILSYLYVRRRTARKRDLQSQSVVTGPSRLLVFAGIATLWSVAYVVLLAANGLIFRRIGFDGLVAAYGDLPGWQFVVIRGFDRVGAPMAALLLLALVRYRGPGRAALVASCVTTAGSTLLVIGINSRLGSILDVLTIGLPVVLLTRPSRRRRSVTLTAIGGTIVALYLVGTATNVRADFGTVGLDIQQFNPFYHAASTGETPVATRLNCIDLMARITPTALDQGFSWGSSWVPAVVSSAGPFISAEAAQAYKQTLSTTAKYYLMRRYANLALPDYPSCALTDAYGNLGPFGLPLAAVSFGTIAALAAAWITRPIRAWQVVAGIFLLADVIYFEGEFIGLGIRFVQELPFILALVVISPLVVRGHRRYASGAPRPRAV